MNHWPFIIAAYALVLGASTALTVWAWFAMRAAEQRADSLTRR
jgi:hypothetical protein